MPAASHSTAPARTSAAAESREFAFTEAHFQAVRVRVRELTGIALSEVKQDLVYSRLSRRLRALRLPDFDAYLDHLGRNPDSENVEFINALTTNLTAFFREAHHFDDLRDRVLPELLQQRRNERRIRIWSAGCSTGEEPYSLAITLHEALGAEVDRWDALILATDIDTGVLATGSRGQYRGDRLNGLSPERLGKHFRPVAGSAAGDVAAREHLRQLIRFRQLNLNGAWPMKCRFDVVFCRNVVIYFDKPTQQVLFNRIAGQMAPGGHLYIGHSENLFRICDRFRHLGRTIHQRVEPGS